jgi:hypothetical protein
MLETLGQISTITHVITGIITLVAGPVAIFANSKHVRLHRFAGKAFALSMLWVCLSAIVGYFKYSDNLFYQLLLGISLMVLGQTWLGVSAMRRFKGKGGNALDYIATSILLIDAVFLMYKGFTSYQAQVPMMFVILFGVFGVGNMITAIKFNRAFLGERDKLFWYKEHIGTMFGVFIASNTAFLVNVGGALPDWVQWFGPTIALVPVQVYFLRKLAKPKTATA